jgi:hypothetical protein
MRRQRSRSTTASPAPKPGQRSVESTHRHRTVVPAKPAAGPGAWPFLARWSLLRFPVPQAPASSASAAGNHFARNGRIGRVARPWSHRGPHRSDHAAGRTPRRRDEPLQRAVACSALLTTAGSPVTWRTAVFRQAAATQAKSSAVTAARCSGYLVMKSTGMLPRRVATRPVVS